MDKRGQAHERQLNGSRARLSPERGPELSPGLENPAAGYAMGASVFVDLR
jgi:hypothetical protein